MGSQQNDSFFSAVLLPTYGIPSRHLDNITTRKMSPLTLITVANTTFFPIMHIYLLCLHHYDSTSKLYLFLFFYCDMIVLLKLNAWVHSEKCSQALHCLCLIIGTYVRKYMPRGFQYSNISWSDLCTLCRYVRRYTGPLLLHSRLSPWFDGGGKLDPEDLYILERSYSSTPARAHSMILSAVYARLTDWLAGWPTTSSSLLSSLTLVWEIGPKMHRE